MSSLNKVMIIGRVGKDPELRQTNNGKSVCNFSVATSTKTGHGSDGYGKEEVEWHRIIAWEKLADNCRQFLSKGKLCYVEGRLVTRQYDKDGQKHFTTEIVAHTVQFLSPKEDVSQSDHNQAQFPRKEQDFNDLPF